MEAKLNLYQRLYLYQKERFPFIGHGCLITAFTFSAIAYSRICRGVSGFISLSDFGIGIGMSFTFFLLLRICDEFKDHEDDKKYRSYLPVPRGLVSLSELKKIGIAIVFIQLAFLLIFQSMMIPLYLVIMGYLFLMTKEFFVESWLRERQLLYILSHMMIIPLIDLYSSGLDWTLAGHRIHLGVAWFMLVSFLNGLVIEIGRKIRTVETEEEGVVSYTKLYGIKTAIFIWIGLITLTLMAAIGAAHYAGYSAYALVFLSALWLVCILPAIFFLKTPTTPLAKRIEKFSGIWTVFMYLSLGAIPMIKNLLI